MIAPDDAVVGALRSWTAAAGAEVRAVVARVGEREILVVEVGDVDSVECGPGLVLGPVVAMGAESFVLLHTHRHATPPSAADHAATRRLRAAAAMIGVRFDGHWVVRPADVVPCDGSSRAAAA